MAQQTVVGWIEEQIKIYLPSIHQKGLQDVFEQAKQMDNKPIELPSDEEIIEEAYKQGAMIFSFTDGAKWMRDKILNK